jgi:predicted nucleic acid-binding protein
VKGKNLPEGDPRSETQSARFLVDTSALMAFIEGEEGSDLVEEALKREDTLLPWPALLEVYYVTLRENGQAEANQRYALIRQLPVEIQWEMDEPTLLTAGKIKAEHRISLADAMIAAFAIRQGAILVHKDPEFETLAGLVPMKSLPYKSSPSR